MLNKLHHNIIISKGSFPQALKDLIDTQRYGHMDAHSVDNQLQETSASM